MAATYDPTEPTLKDEARSLLGDAHSGTSEGAVSDPLYQDETIEARIAKYGFNEGVARLADGLCTKYGQYPDEHAEDGGVKVKWSERVRSWRELAKTLRQDAAGQNPTRKRAVDVKTSDRSQCLR